MRYVVTTSLVFVSIIVFAIGALSCAHVQPTSSSGDAETLPADFADVLRHYENDWRNKDAAALAALFTEDGFVLSPGHSPVQGRIAIQQAYIGAGGPLYLHALHWAREG